MTRRTPMVLASFVLVAALVRPMAAQTPAQIYRNGDAGVVNPMLLKEVRPTYTSAAMRERIEGVVYLEAVITRNGTVGDVRVTRSLDAVNGLDAEAVRAAKQWMFTPATRNGQPVDVYVTLELAFRLSQFGAGAHRSYEAGLVMPVVVREVKPTYTPEAMREKIQGSAAVDIVVGVDGTVTDARLFQSVDRTFGLDEAAMRAARQWTFKPGTLNGQPVPVVTTIHLDFRLH